MEKEELEPGLWITDTYSQRMTSKGWKAILLNRQDSIIYKGKTTKLIAKNLGYGVVEISKDLSKTSEE